GTLSVNMIGVSEDGAVYVGNLTQNGVTSPFRLYRWFDDSPDALPELAWQGDPGSGTPNRWGDTFSVRGSETFPQILLGSRTGIVASVISPSFGVNSMPLVIRTDADAGNFGLGIAF